MPLSFELLCVAGFYHADPRSEGLCAAQARVRSFWSFDTVRSLFLSPKVISFSPRDAPAKMKNIHYAGQGYDMVRGNPRCSGSGCVTGFDPGFSVTYNVIDLLYSTGKTTPDGRYLVPDSLDVESAVTCSLVSSTSAVHSAYDYQKSLGVDAKEDASFGFGAWGAKVHCKF